MHICSCCHTEVYILHRHHILPKVLGGVDAESNIIKCCEECHGKIHGRNMLNHRELTLKGLRQAKARGVKLGGARPEAEARHAAVKREADQNALRVSKIILQSREGGQTYRAIADHLNQLNVATARGGKWHSSTVKNYHLRVTERELI